MVYYLLYSSVLGEPLMNPVGFRQWTRVLGRGSAQCDPTTDRTCSPFRHCVQVYEAEVANSPGDCGSGCHNSGYLRIYGAHFGLLIFFNICEMLVGWRTRKHPVLLSKRRFLYLKGLVVIFMTTYIQSFLRIHLSRRVLRTSFCTLH